MKIENRIMFYNKDEVFYDATHYIEQGLEYWYLPNQNLSEIKNLVIKIYDDKKLIFKL